MTVIRQPLVSLTLASADIEVENTPQKVLMLGQMNDSTLSPVPSATVATLYPNVANATFEGLFGKRSMLGHMIRAFKRIAPNVQLDVIPLADHDTPTAAQKTVVFTGPATAAGTYEIIVGSEKEHRYLVDVNDGDSATVIGARLETLIAADVTCPFIGVAVTGTVTLTAEDAGKVAEKYTLRAVGEAAGTTVTVDNTVAGAVDPVFTAALDPAGEQRYQAVIWPWDDWSVPLAVLDARFNVSNRIQDGVLFVSEVLSHADLRTAGQAENSQSLVFLGKLLEDSGSIQGGSVPELPEVQNTMLAAVRALRLTSGASIARYLTTSASLDQFGGTALASLPLFNTNLPDLGLPRPGDGFTDTEIEQLHDDGIYVMGANSSGTNGLVGEVVTTYKTDPAANPDPTWKYLPYVDTSSNVREYMHNNLKKRFAQSRLTEGAVSRGRDMVNEVVFRAYVEKLYTDLAGPDFVLVQDGEAARLFFKNNLTVVLDLVNGRITTTMLVPIVTQMREIIATLKISFSTEG